MEEENSKRGLEGGLGMVYLLPVPSSCKGWIEYIDR